MDGENLAMRPSARLSVRVQIAAAAAAVFACALVAAAPGAGAPPALKQKEAQAQRILAQVQALDIQLGRMGEALNGAQYELDGIRKHERRNTSELATAKKQYAVARRRLNARVVAVYESEPPTTTDAILGAASLSGLLDRLELVNTAAALDRQVARRAVTLRSALARRARAIAAERVRQAAIVSSLADHRQALDAALGQRRTLLSSIQGEVQHLRAQAAARQAQLAAAARARLAAEARQRERLARLAQAHQAAVAAAAAAAAKRAAPATTTTSTTAPAATTTTTGQDPSAATTTTDPVAPPPPPVVPNNTAGHPQAATLALQYLGVPYVFGGATPAGFDCSGFVMFIYAKLGISLPHYAAAQYQAGTAVSRADLQPGDLVFFDSLNHVGIYIGDSQFVDAPHTGLNVQISSIAGWYADNYVGARRL